MPAFSSLLFQLSRGSAASAGGADVDQGTKDLVNLVDSLPVLMEKKKALEQHTAILQGAMDLIAARDVPTLYETSNNMVTTGMADKKALAALLRRVEVQGLELAAPRGPAKLPEPFF